MGLPEMILLAAETAKHSTDHGTSIDWRHVFDVVRYILSALCLVGGLFFVFAGTIGVLRLPDFYTRIHAAGMTDTLGAELIMLGLIIQAGFSLLSLKLLLVAFILLITSPTATHALANAAHHAGLKPLLGPFKVADPTQDAEEGGH